MGERTVREWKIEVDSVIENIYKNRTAATNIKSSIMYLEIHQYQLDACYDCLKHCKYEGRLSMMSDVTWCKKYSKRLILDWPFPKRLPECEATEDWNCIPVERINNRKKRRNL